MLKVIDVFKVGNMVSVTLEGACETLKNNSKLVDENGNVFNVVSVAMTRHDNPSDISQYTTVLITPCSLKKGEKLHIA
jgi:ribosomal protein L21E